MDEATKCKKCREQIVWCSLVSKTNPDGKPHPLDAVPSFEGTIERVREGLGYVGRFVPPTERNGRRLYVSHFATCPDAASFRKKGKP